MYVTGRSTRAAPAQSYQQFLAQTDLTTIPGTIDDTAEEVTRLGGTGIAVRCDHTREDEVRALVARVEREQGRLDLLVNNAWGGHESFTPESLTRSIPELLHAFVVANSCDHLVSHLAQSNRDRLTEEEVRYLQSIIAAIDEAIEGEDQ